MPLPANDPRRRAVAKVRHRHPAGASQEGNADSRPQTLLATLAAKLHVGYQFTNNTPVVATGSSEKSDSRGAARLESDRTQAAATITPLFRTVRGHQPQRGLRLTQVSRHAVCGLECVGRPPALVLLPTWWALIGSPILREVPHSQSDRPFVGLCGRACRLRASPAGRRLHDLLHAATIRGDE